MILAVIIAFILWGVQPSGPLQQGFRDLLTDVKGILQNMANNAASNF